MHYYQFNIGDYKSHTDHLDLHEDLAFRRMMDWCYLHESPLPLDLNVIAKKILMRSHTDSIANVLGEFFHKTEEGYLNKRINSEVEAFKAKSDKARKSAEARWNKVKTQCDGNANALKTQCDGNAKHKPLNTKQETLNINQETVVKDKPSAKANEPFLIFSYWKEVFKKNDSAKLTPKRLKAIKARIKEGYTLDEIKSAVYGCSVTPWNNGTDPNNYGKKNDCLELICRSGENIERFAGNAQQAAPQKYSAVTERNINTLQDWINE